MKKILFVCHGNICRSPMAEFLCKEAVKHLGCKNKFEIASAAVSQEELGNGVYPPVRDLLNRLGIDCSEKKARQITSKDFDHYDLIILMDSLNVECLKALFPEYPKDKVKLLLSYINSNADVDDPWYTRDFERTQTEISKGIAGLLTALLTKEGFSPHKIECSCNFGKKC